MALQSKEDLFREQMAETLDAERTLMEGMREMSRKVSNRQLKNGIEEHIRQTEQQVRNLEKCFETMGATPSDVQCEEARAMVRDYRMQVQNLSGDALVDAETAAAEMKIEGFEIGTYRGLVASAEMMGNGQVRDLLQENLRQEELMADRLEDIFRGME